MSVNQDKYNALVALGFTGAAPDMERKFWALYAAGLVKPLSLSAGGAVIGPNGVPVLQEALLHHEVPTGWSIPAAWNSATITDVAIVRSSYAGAAAAAGRAYTPGGTIAQRTRTAYFASSATTAGSTTGIRTNTGQLILGSVAGEGGFSAQVNFMCADAATVANARCFNGGYDNASGDIGNVEPSTLLNCFGVGSDAGEANLSLMHNDGSGACTKTDLGSGFPANTVDIPMQFSFWAQSQATEINWRLVNMATGAVAQGVANTNLPANNIMMALHNMRNNGATALGVRIAHQGMFVSSI